LVTVLILKIGMDKKAYAVIDALPIRADFMPSLFSLNAAILLISVTIAGN